MASISRKHNNYTCIFSIVSKIWGRVGNFLNARCTFDDHLHDLKQTLECFQKANLQLRRDKCRFCCKKIDFLGHLLSGDGVQSLPSNVGKIEQQAGPTDVKRYDTFQS